MGAAGRCVVGSLLVVGGACSSHTPAGPPVARNCNPAVAIDAAPNAGFPSPNEALANFTRYTAKSISVPTHGYRRAASNSAASVIFVSKDGRVQLPVSHTANGWFIGTVERCD